MDSSTARNRSALPPFERLAHSTVADQEMCSISEFQGSFEPSPFTDVAQYPANLAGRGTLRAG